MKVKYREFIEENFLIRDKEGNVVPFRFNDVQAHYYDLLIKEYPGLQGVRENILKFRQPGISSLIDAIFTVDFILSALRKLPVVSAQIISHKESETRTLFRRVDFFLTSFLEKHGIPRAEILKTDNALTYLEAKSGAEIYIGTAGAKTLGRGGTLQRLHWSEVAFFPQTDILNAEELVPAAEQQVADGVGMIFRESTGNRLYDFFHTEYENGKTGKSEFKSRFFGWWLHKAYTRQPPQDFRLTDEERLLMERYGATHGQVYWRRRKIETAPDQEKARREYPSNDVEAFLAAGDQYFDARVLSAYKAENITQPLLRGNIHV